MLQFHPSGIEQTAIVTSLGTMACYRPAVSSWPRFSLGAMPLLFLHGFGGGASAYEWSKVYPAFIHRHPLLVPDLLGWGASDHPTRDYQVSDYLITLTEFIEQTCDRPVVVVAASLTGAIGVRLAIEHPDLVAGLFLVCPSGFMDFGQDAGRRLPVQWVGTPLVGQLVYRLGATNEVAVRNFLEQFLFSDRDRLCPETVAAYLASAQQPNGDYAALSFLRGDLYFDLSRYLGQLTLPTWMLWGEAARFTPIGLGERLAALNPTAIHQFIPVPQVGVLPHLEQPAIVIGYLDQFLASLGATIRYD